jgi:hypothetical protein
MCIAAGSALIALIDKIIALYGRHLGLRTVVPKIETVPAVEEWKSA